MWQAWPLGTRLQNANMAHRRERRTTSTRTRTNRSWQTSECERHLGLVLRRRRRTTRGKQHRTGTTTTMTTAGIGMTTAMRIQQTTLEASTGHTSPLDTSDKQSHDYTSANPNHYLARKQHTQHHGTTTARAFNNSCKKTPPSYTLT